MLKIDKSLFQELRKHGEETYPYECCGVLLGEANDGQKTVRAVIRCANTRLDSPHNRYHIDPRELIRIQRAARDRELDVIGFYHSHPDHPARWSQTDLADAHWLGCSYVITSVSQGSAEQTNSFLLDGGNEEDKRFADEPLQLEE